MNSIMNKKKLSLLLLFFCFLTGIAYGQQLDDKHVKIEIMVKDGNKPITVQVRSSSISFSKSANLTAKDSIQKNYYIAIDLERHDINLLTAFAKNKKGLDGQIMMTDTNGKTPARKIEFKKATLDALTDQFTNDYSSAYLSLNCSGLVIDGINIE